MFHSVVPRWSQTACVSEIHWNFHGQKGRKRFSRRDYLCVVLSELKRIDRRRIWVFLSLGSFHFTEWHSLPVEAAFFKSHSFVHILYTVRTFMQERKTKLNSIGLQSLYHWLSVCMEELRFFWHEIRQSVAQKGPKRVQACLNLFLLDGWNNMPSEQQVCFLIHLNIWKEKKTSAWETDVTHVWCLEPNVTDVNNTYCLTWITRYTCLSIFPVGWDVVSPTLNWWSVSVLILSTTTRVQSADYTTGVWMCMPVRTCVIFRNTCTDIESITQASGEKKYNA